MSGSREFIFTALECILLVRCKDWNDRDLWRLSAIVTFFQTKGKSVLTLDSTFVPDYNGVGDTTFTNVPEPAMSFRYLFGPLTQGFELSNLQPMMDTGTLVPFSLVPREPSVLTVDWNDSWEGLLARCPEGFQPYFIALPLAYQSIPTWLYRAPVPLVGVAADWSLLFHQYRQQLPWLE